jgi:hypothetical protein
MPHVLPFFIVNISTHINKFVKYTLFIRIEPFFGSIQGGVFISGAEGRFLSPPAWSE